ncbi:MAG: hypothetical protein Q7R87_00095 [Nanoarchaeota archaeon]|nr:hypothetical protein [Nanoarchaeota archaeon]
MAKRNKRLKNAIESYKEEIEKHFDKLDRDIEDNNGILAGYHIKEIDKSLIATLENKISMLKMEKEYSELIKKYRDKLEEYRRKLNFE